MAVFLCQPQRTCHHQLRMVPNFEDFFQDFHTTLNNFVMKKDKDEEDRLFKVDVDVTDFTPEELSVKIVKDMVTIEGKHEEKKDEHGSVSRHFIRKYTLPEGCRSEDVVSNLSSDGILTVSAPKVVKKPIEDSRTVPINTNTTPSKSIEVNNNEN